ncbi:M55 family metallopeptidase [Fusibacter paucivorans]|uniref:M55 family metallopeptidase n=1 Tax=Fusibacter paucivorans TaxID=76009 RepID=A0ABS5PKN2_9FIRM|nr:M55 family metallopeptidase [Fusibacter paucivorans]MBS7525720.1 M55 family metallopeptidase [Fusibacter paucivorans]
MKIYISADMEGVAGVVSWPEVELGSNSYTEAQRQMTREVAAICEAVQAAGATEVLVKDAHDSGRNLIISELPHDVDIHRAWSKHPYVMMMGLDRTFDACILTGYHDATYGNGNPLAHTMNASKYQWIKLNGVLMSEMMMNAYIAAYEGVPVIAVTGDAAICSRASQLMPNVKAIAVKQGEGGGCTTMHPDRAVEVIQAEVKEAMQLLKEDPEQFKLNLPECFVLEVCFTSHVDAYRAGYYTGVESIDAHAVKFKTEDFFELLKMFFFAC